VFVIALIGLKELSPALRDQLMVTLRDRALIEAKAKGLTEADIEAALRHPFRQLLKPDVIISSFAVSIMLLIYYTSVGFSVIYLTNVFGFSLKDANGLGNWNWGFNVIAVILIGIISDRFRVRKPFMVIGGVLGAVMVVVYLEQAGHHPGYYSLALMLALLSLGLGIAYTPWMASFTETVEARNPALIATGLAIWGWIIRIVVFAAYCACRWLINSVTPLVNYGAQVQAYATQYKGEIAFATTHHHGRGRGPEGAAAGHRHRAEDPAEHHGHRAEDPAGRAGHRAEGRHATRQRAEVRARARGDPGSPGAVHQAGHLQEPGLDPPALVNQAIAAAGGGAKGLKVLTTISANQAAITGVIAVAPDLQKVAPYAADLQTIAPYSAQLTAIAPYSSELTTMAPFAVQLTALSKVPPQVFPYLQATPRTCRTPRPRRQASGRPGTGSASAASSSSCSASRCCAGAGGRVTPSGTRPSTRPRSRRSWPSSRPPSRSHRLGLGHRGHPARAGCPR